MQSHREKKYGIAEMIIVLLLFCQTQKGKLHIRVLYIRLWTATYFLLEILQFEVPPWGRRGRIRPQHPLRVVRGD